MAHTYPIASDLSYLVLLKRQAEQGSTTDSANRRLYRVSGYRQFIADVDDHGDAAQVHPLRVRTEWVTE
jgi:hypothetical protein